MTVEKNENKVALGQDLCGPLEAGGSRVLTQVAKERRYHSVCIWELNLLWESKWAKVKIDSPVFTRTVMPPGIGHSTFSALLSP